MFVVNCSQILYLCRPETTAARVSPASNALWIALKFCIFVVLKQRNLQILPRNRVVNCSQILYLCRPETTITILFVRLTALWIALKFCIFVVLKQQRQREPRAFLCCELLSNFVSLSSWNNWALSEDSWLTVVNCSQILYLCRPETTRRAYPWAKPQLWIALKFCIFVVLKQPRTRHLNHQTGCELLSNFVSLSSWNNWLIFKKCRTGVVNCSQILYLCRPETTSI